MIGSSLKHNYPGYKAWIITSGKEFLREIGLKPKVKYMLFNGALECTLAGYELYEGSKKQRAE
jgi:putative N6-adenine-specific DNA methylase